MVWVAVDDITAHDCIANLQASGIWYLVSLQSHSYQENGTDIERRQFVQ